MSSIPYEKLDPQDAEHLKEFIERRSSENNTNNTEQVREVLRNLP